MAVCVGQGTASGYLSMLSSFSSAVSSSPLVPLVPIPYDCETGVGISEHGGSKVSSVAKLYPHVTPAKDRLAISEAATHLTQLSEDRRQAILEAIDVLSRADAETVRGITRRLTEYLGPISDVPVQHNPCLHLKVRFPAS